MNCERTITEGGMYTDITIIGEGLDLYRDGLVIDAPGEIVWINTLHVSNVRTALTVKRAKAVMVNKANFFDNWGDSLCFRASNVHIKKLKVRKLEPRLPYERFHVDSCAQIYAVKSNGYTLNPRGTIKNIIIDSIDIECNSNEANVLMLSEFNKYTRFRIGATMIRLRVNCPFWLNANNLSRSVIGGGIVDIKNIDDTIPAILIKDRPKGGVCSGQTIGNNTFIGIPNMERCYIGNNNYIIT